MTLITHLMVGDALLFFCIEECHFGEIRSRQPSEDPRAQFGLISQCFWPARRRTPPGFSAAHAEIAVFISKTLIATAGVKEIAYLTSTNKTKELHKNSPLDAWFPPDLAGNSWATLSRVSQNI